MATVVSAVPLSINAMLMYFRAVEGDFLETRVRVGDFPTDGFPTEQIHARNDSEQFKFMLL